MNDRRRFDLGRGIVAPIHDGDRLALSWESEGAAFRESISLTPLETARLAEALDTIFDSANHPEGLVQ